MRLLLIAAVLAGIAAGQGRRPDFRDWPFVTYTGCLDPAKIHTIEAYYQCEDAYSDRIIKQFQAKTKPGSRLIFSCNFEFSHGLAVRGFSIESMKVWVDTMHDLGVERVDMNPTPGVWLKHDQASIAKYDQVIAYIHGKGMQISFNPTTFPGEGVRGFDQWKKVATDMYAELARRYHPEIFSVMHEPFTFQFRIGTAPTPAQWRDFVETTIAVVKKESPETKCVTSFQIHEMDVLEELLKIPSLDGIGLDIYHQFDDFKTSDKMAKVANDAGKFAYIAESWRPMIKMHEGKPWWGDDFGVADPYLGKLDGKWMKAMTLYALSRHMPAVTFFWTFPLFTYDAENPDPVTNSKGYYPHAEKALLSGERTATYQALKSLIAEYGKP